MRLISILHTVIGALNLGMALAHLIEMAPKRALSGRDWLTTQHAYRDFGKVASVAIPLSIALSLFRAVRSRRMTGAARLFIVHAVCSLATVGIWANANEPVNREIVHWDPEHLPSDWRERRDQWEFGHALTAMLHLVGFAALLAPTGRRA